MERVSHRLPEPLIQDLDDLVEIMGHPNRSELIRHAVRQYRNEHRRELETYRQRQWAQAYSVGGSDD